MWNKVSSVVGDTEPVALTDLSVESPALLPRCHHVSAELRQPIGGNPSAGAVGFVPTIEVRS
jgi:hypothetical protein